VSPYPQAVNNHAADQAQSQHHAKDAGANADDALGMGEDALGLKQV